jgi:uncharacterized membrane protein
MARRRGGKGRGRAPNTSQLRAAMPSGRTPSIDSAHEPSAASFDTDDEAAGRSPSAEAIEQALAHEANAPVPPRHGRAVARDVRPAISSARASSAASRSHAAVDLRAALTSSGFVLGLGLGGFIDGIALHQIAQWHNMGSAVLPPTTMDAMMQNMRWDGLFHLATLILTLVGVVMLWKEGLRGTLPPSLRVLLGRMLLGWGVFNLVEGIVDHHVLELHHVRDLPAHVPAYDWTFLAIGGALFIVVGWLMSRVDVAHARRR